MFHEWEEARNPDPCEPGQIEAEGLAEGDAHAAGESREAAGPAFADGLYLDVALRAAIEFDEDERCVRAAVFRQIEARSEEHTSELQSLMRISYAVFCLKKKTSNKNYNTLNQHQHERDTQNN